MTKTLVSRICQHAGHERYDLVTSFMATLPALRGTQRAMGASSHAEAEFWWSASTTSEALNTGVGGAPLEAAQTARLSDVRQSFSRRWQPANRSRSSGCNKKQRATREGSEISQTLSTKP